MKAGAAAVTARTGIPTGTQCTVSETLPNPPTGWSFGTPTYDPSATVTIATKDQVVTVTVQNTLTRDTGSLAVTKYHDQNKSGGHTAGEPYLNGWTIFLDIDGSGTVTAGDISASRPASGVAPTSGA